MSRSPIAAAANKWSRKLHRLGAILAALPLLVILSTGILLQLKKNIPWIQPPIQRGTSHAPTLSFDRILAIASSVPQARITSWADIDRLDVQPRRGIVKVVPFSRHEIQIDTHTGDILQVRHRRSDLIESLHDGSFFHPLAKLYIFLPAGIILLALWFTGIYLWLLPHLARRSRRRREHAAARPAP